MTDGGVVYPEPALDICTDCTDLATGFTFELHTSIPPIKTALAIPVTPPDGAEDIATAGGVRYPPPLFVTAMNLIAPFTRDPEDAVAVDADPTTVRV